MNHGSLFSGIGGFDLAAEWMGWENVFSCEINPFGNKILNYYWPDTIHYEDIKKTDFTKYRGTIDILSGGFPCQGFSIAGKRLGTDDERYLWPEMLRAIREIRPLFVVGENVSGITSMEDKSGVWSEVFPKVESRKIVRYDSIDEYEKVYTRQAKMLISTICEDLEKEGYQVQPFNIPAAAVGAPHKRERIWFIAYSIDGGYNTRREEKEKENGIQREKRKAMDSRESNGTNIQRITTNSESIGSGRIRNKEEETRPRKGDKLSGGEYRISNDEQTTTNTCSIGSIPRNNHGENGRWEPGCRPKTPHSKKGWGKFPTQSPICSRDDELSTKLDGITFPKWRNESIKGYGNAVVPELVFELFKIIEEYELHN